MALRRQRNWSFRMMNSLNSYTTDKVVRTIRSAWTDPRGIWANALHVLHSHFHSFLSNLPFKKGERFSEIFQKKDKAKKRSRNIRNSYTTKSRFRNEIEIDLSRNTHHAAIITKRAWPLSPITKGMFAKLFAIVYNYSTLHESNMYRFDRIPFFRL